MKVAPTANAAATFVFVWGPRAYVEFTEVDIEQDPEAAAFVESVNGGNQTVPTLVFADGSAATNPSLKQVQEKVSATG